MQYETILKDEYITKKYFCDKVIFSLCCFQDY